ncbi:MAG: hypothetical protein ACTSXZ_06700, partial [Alphaproteobacteria bacterium]
MFRWLIKNRKKILFSLLILALFLAAAELLARWWLAGYARREYGIDIDQYREVELVVDEGQGWKWGGKVVFRGLREVSFEKPTGLYRIITTGDSCCWGAMVAADATFSARLEVLLRDEHGPKKVEVLNAGVVGYGTEQVTQLTRETLAHFVPDLIIYYGTGEEAAKWVVGGYESIIPELERYHRLFFYSKAFLILNHLVRKLHKKPPYKSRLVQNDDLNDLQRAVEEIGARLMLVEYLYV